MKTDFFGASYGLQMYLQQSLQKIIALTASRLWFCNAHYFNIKNTAVIKGKFLKLQINQQTVKF